MNANNDNTIIPLTKAMVFHRDVGEGKALMLGTLTLERKVELSDTGRYLVDMGVNPCLFTEQSLPIHYNDRSVTYKLLTVGEKLKNSNWQSIAKDAPREFAVIELLPLFEEKGVYCFFAALQKPVMKGTNDSFHQFDGSFWNQIVSPAKTNGKTPDQVFELPVWEIEGDKFSINARNDEGLLYYQIRNTVLAECHKNNLSSAECEKTLIERLKEQMKAEDVPTYNGMNAYNDKAYMEFLNCLQKVTDPTKSRIMSKSDYEERGKEVSAAIRLATLSLADKNSETSLSM